MRFQTFKLDANQQIFFSRQLEHIMSKPYEVKYPGMKARRIFPVSYEAGTGAQTITYRMYDQVGLAKIIANYARDLPRVDIKGKEFTAKVRSLGCSYGYSLDDIRAAQMAGLNLDASKSKAARRGMLLKEEQIAWNGDASTGLSGMLTTPAIPQILVSPGAIGVATWPQKTPDEILYDLNDCVAAVSTNSMGIHLANTVLMPLSAYNFIKAKRVTDTGVTILKYFLDSNPEIEEVIPIAKYLDASGPVFTRQMIAYERNPDVVTLEVPQEFEQLPPQEQGLEFEIPCHQKCGGVIIKYPLAFSMAYGF